MHPAYEKRLLRVMAYIHANLDGDLSLDALADVAAMSRFHWHRVFTAMVGETAAQATRRIRLNRAACDLVQTGRPIAEIAADCGYTNARSFARVFRDAYGLPPARFRAQGVLLPLLFQPKPKGNPMFPIETLDQPGRRLMAMPHKGAYPTIGETFEKISAIATARNLWPAVQGMAGIYYDDPDATAEADLTSHAGMIVGPDFAIPDDFDEVHIPGGRFAVMHYKGSYAGLNAAYKHLYGDWLASSGAELRNQPPFELYLNNPRDVAPDDLLTDVCVPIV